jgi:hypothetical protein
MSEAFERLFLDLPEASFIGQALKSPMSRENVALSTGLLLFTR